MSLPLSPLTPCQQVPDVDWGAQQPCSALGISNLVAMQDLMDAGEHGAAASLAHRAVAEYNKAVGGAACYRFCLQVLERCATSRQKWDEALAHCKKELSSLARDPFAQAEEKERGRQLYLSLLAQQGRDDPIVRQLKDPNSAVEFTQLLASPSQASIGHGKRAGQFSLGARLLKRRRSNVDWRWLTRERADRAVDRGVR